MDRRFRDAPPSDHPNLLAPDAEPSPVPAGRRHFQLLEPTDAHAASRGEAAPDASATRDDRASSGGDVKVASRGGDGSVSIAELVEADSLTLLDATARDSNNPALASAADVSADALRARRVLDPSSKLRPLGDPFGRDAGKLVSGVGVWAIADSFRWVEEIQRTAVSQAISVPLLAERSVIGATWDAVARDLAAPYARISSPADVSLTTQADAFDSVAQAKTIGSSLDAAVAGFHKAADMTRVTTNLLNGIEATACLFDAASCFSDATPPLALDHLWNSTALLDGIAHAVARWHEAIPFPLPFAPSSFDRDFILLQDPEAAPEAKLAALDRMAGRLRWVGSRRRIRRVLPLRARELGLKPRELLQNELQAAIVLALGTADHPQTMRFGNSWVVDERQKIIAVPPRQLEAGWYIEWFIIAVARNVERSLLDRPDRVPTLENRSLEEPEDEVAVLPAEWPAPPEDDPLALLVERDERDEKRRRLAACLALATPRQREILALLHTGLSSDEAAGRLGITESTLRVQLKRLRDRARAAGLAA